MNSQNEIEHKGLEMQSEYYLNEFPSRPTKAIIDLVTYKENLLKVKNALNKKIMAIVKANAYGHGLVNISKEANELVDFFGVAILEEAAILRDNEIDKPILVLGYIDPDNIDYVAKNEIRVAIYSYEQWRNWSVRINKKSINNRVYFHLKINSGMNRLGFKDRAELEKTLKEMISTQGAKVEGFFTHFATADVPGDQLIKKQEIKFLEMIENINEKEYIVHIANSAYALESKKENLFDMVRLGISGYGLLPDQQLKNKMTIETKPILQLKSEIVHIQELSPGETVGYGATYQASKKERIGVIPMGYADGLLRRYAKGSYVLVNGERRYFAGRICMDQAMIKLEDKDEIGDEVVIYGKQGDEEITLEMAGEWSETINYEVACLISERVRREYVK